MGPDSSDAREEAVVDGVPVNQTHKNLICSLIYTTLLTTFLIHSHSHSFLQLHNPGKQNNSTTLANRTIPQPWQTEQFHNPGKQNNSTTLANRTIPQPWQTEQLHNPGKQNNYQLPASAAPQPWQTEQLQSATLNTQHDDEEQTFTWNDIFKMGKYNSCKLYSSVTFKTGHGHKN